MSKAPYTFVPVILNDNAVVDTPFHDQQAENGLTGEIRITLKTLTPFLPGHYQYKITQLQNDTGIDRNLYDEEKNILEPLFLEGKTDSPVLISGSSIKGMLRHSIGAMFGSPMERVQEQKYSYRPNLGIASGKYQAREAVITEIDLANKVLQVDILNGVRNAYFLREAVFNRLDRNYGDDVTNDDLLSSGLCQNNYLKRYWENKRQRTEHIKTQRIVIPSNNTHNHKLLPQENNYTLLKYRAGIDGNGEVAITFNNSQKDDVAVLVPTRLLNAPACSDKEISKEIIEQFLLTKKELASKKHGHYSRNKDIKPYLQGIENPNLETGQLIYVEIDNNNKVVSFGHNFRYRWRYADSVRTVNGNEREIVKKQDAEEVNENAAKLTATRSLFGYVDGGEENTEKNLNLDIVKDKKKNKDYVRFAGRIAINTAVEVLGESDNLPKRFIQDQNHYHIPLKPLGEPNASAVEFYLNQDEIQTHGYVNTYGDLPGVEGSGVELNGRKFYRHQPKASQKAIYQATSNEEIKSKHGTLARFICNAGRTFKYTLRFKNVRDWELGAILLALNPDLIRQTDFSQDDKELDGVVYAQKLGYGRPLGLGSVVNQIDEICLLNSQNATMETATKQAKDYVQIFVNDANQKNLPVEDWLKVMNYAASKDQIYAYPTKNVRGETTIYNYHTDIRKTHSENRRKKIPKNGRSHGDQVKP